MKSGALLKTLMVTLLAAAAGPCAAADDRPEFTLEGLQLIEDSNLALVYAEPGIDLSRYRRIHLDAPSVAFKKNWKDIQNRYDAGRVSDGDMEKIKAELSELFMQVFAKTLEDGGYALADGPGDDVLGVKSAIINLDIVAPDVNSPGVTRTYSETAGEMTLYMELYDSVSGDLLAKALDRKADRRTGYFQWRNRVTNRAAANRILKAWAGVLKEGLDDARAAAPNAP